MRFRHITAFLIFIFFLVGLSSAQERLPGQLIVQLEKTASVELLLKNLHPAEAKAQLLSQSWNIWQIHFDGIEDDAALQRARQHPSVLLAQFNHRVSRRSVAPNDSLFGIQWNLHNTGQSGGTQGADISAVNAWELGTGGVTALGDTIVIAVIDDGFYLPHNDLRFWKNRHDPPNGIDDDLNGYIDDFHGWDVRTNTDVIPNDAHGAHVAGIAAAAGNNSIGVAGVAYDARIMPVSIPDYEEAQVVKAYSYIFDMRKVYNVTNGQKGAFVVATNSSFGQDFAKPEDYPVWCALYDSLGSVGIISIGSTMNITTDVDIAGDIPSNCPSDHLIVATSTNRFDNRSSGAAFGLKSVDMGAPGTAIQSTILFNNYGFQSGTSMASPHVAGAVALLYSAACSSFIQSHHLSPAITALTIKDYILKGTDILPSLDGLTVSGGRLNLFKSIHAYYNDYCVTCLTVTETLNTVACHGEANGNIALSVSQGVPPYQYEWSSGDTSSALTGLPRGKYSVKISDANGCEKFKYYDITQPFPLVLNLLADSAMNGAGGSAASYVSGGTEPYSYQWNDANNSVAATLNDLPPGEYTVTVTDFRGCQISKSVVVGNVVGSVLLQPVSDAVKIFPNPAHGVAHIEATQCGKSHCHLLVFDISGKLREEMRFSGDVFSFDVARYPRGTYILKIISDRSVAFEKMHRY